MAFLGALHRIDGPGSLPGTAQDDEQVLPSNGGRIGVTAKIDLVAEMHQSHAKAAEDTASSSLGRKENGPGPSEALNEVVNGCTLQLLQEQSVLAKDRSQVFLGAVSFRLRMLNQPNWCHEFLPSR
jgi:hypothetical protein